MTKFKLKEGDKIEISTYGTDTHIEIVDVELVMMSNSTYAFKSLHPQTSNFEYYDPKECRVRKRLK